MKQNQKEFRRSLAVFPIGTVMKLTGLTARQIRYYEEYELVEPERTDTNRRMYSLNDVDRLLDIMDLLDDGYNLSEIKDKLDSPQEPYTVVEEKTSDEISDQDVRRALRGRLDFQGRYR